MFEKFMCITVKVCHYTMHQVGSIHYTKSIFTVCIVSYATTFIKWLDILAHFYLFISTKPSICSTIVKCTCRTKIMLI